MRKPLRIRPFRWGRRFCRNRVTRVRRRRCRIHHLDTLVACVREVYTLPPTSGGAGIFARPCRIGGAICAHALDDAAVCIRRVQRPVMRDRKSGCARLLVRGRPEHRCVVMQINALDTVVDLVRDIPISPRVNCDSARVWESSVVPLRPKVRVAWPYGSSLMIIQLAVSTIFTSSANYPVWLSSRG